MKNSSPEKKQGTIISRNTGRYAAVLLVAAISVLPSLHAQQDDYPVDINTILKTLAQLKKSQVDSTKANELQLAQQFLSTAGSTSAATDYYKQAIRATKLEGKSLESLDYQQWEQSSAERFKSRSFRDALAFHLTYLSLTLRHNAGVEMKILLPDLINYTQQVMADYDELGGRPDPVVPGGGARRGGGPQGNANNVINAKAPPSVLDPEFMNQSVSGSVFVKWLQIGGYVSGGDNWELTPGNVDGMYQKTILPEFRLNKDPRLLQYWDQRIQREGDNAAKTKLNFDLDQFNNITKPKLQWQRAQELLVLNQKNRAINDMLNLIKANPASPDVADWISQLEQLIQPAPAAPAPAVSTPLPAPVNSVPAAGQPPQPQS